MKKHNGKNAPSEPDDTYRPTSPRQRRVIIAVTVATVLATWLLLIYRPGGHPRTYPRAGTSACAPGQTSGCVGGRAEVMLIPADSASAASASDGR
jgi:hypothetical protein